MPDTNSLALKLADWEESIIRSLPPVLGMAQDYMVTVPADVFDVWRAHMEEHTSDNPWKFSDHSTAPYAHATRIVSHWPRTFGMRVVRNSSLAADYDTHEPRSQVTTTAHHPA